MGGPDRVTVLAATLKKMRDHYASFAKFTPGPQDIFDYNIGNLWLKGIDGSGTTVAVIEGWDDPDVAAFIHVRDVRYGLPDPVIQTVTRPARCPRSARPAWWRSAATLRILSIRRNILIIPICFALNHLCILDLIRH